MRVLITGGGGNLGSALAPILAAAGHEPVLLDSRALRSPYEFLQGDIRSPEDVRVATRGAEFVVHLAGILGTGNFTARDFYDVNLTGTFNVWEAAAEARVRGLIFSSTMSVYKPHDQPLHPDKLSVLAEDTPPRPRDFYGYTKAAGEEMCRLYGRSHGIPSIALRYGMFSPEPFFPYGIRLLYGGVDVHDVARAVTLSVEAVSSGGVRWDVVNVESRVPFTEEDAPELLTDPLQALDRHYPGASKLLRERGVERLAPIHELYPIDRAASILSYSPECGFDRWLEDLRARPDERTPKNPPWP
ncbi:MAG: NAD(P)-dependent oxidoreductase [Chloroflexota bacterium]|nr:NAD(P)-dependent oxidoreductase [Chloroflexota bacterium]